MTNKNSKNLIFHPLSGTEAKIVDKSFKEKMRSPADVLLWNGKTSAGWGLLISESTEARRVFNDENGIIRCRGRLGSIQASYDKISRVFVTKSLCHIIDHEGNLNGGL